jgi:hypothetical protein
MDEVRKSFDVEKTALKSKLQQLQKDNTSLMSRVVDAELALESKPETAVPSAVSSAGTKDKPRKQDKNVTEEHTVAVKTAAPEPISQEKSVRKPKSSTPPANIVAESDAETTDAPAKKSEKKRKAPVEQPIEKPKRIKKKPATPIPEQNKDDDDAIISEAENEPVPVVSKQASPKKEKTARRKSIKPATKSKDEDDAFGLSFKDDEDETEKPKAPPAKRRLQLTKKTTNIESEKVRRAYLIFTL